MKEISGNVTGKIQFKIDTASWQNLDKFSKKLTAIKRQMGTMHKTLNVQAVVRDVKAVGEKVAKASTAAKQKEYNGHVVAYQKHQQQMDKLYDQAIKEDRRRDAQKIRQAEKFNRDQLRSDLTRDRMNARASRRTGGGAPKVSYETATNRYGEIKLQQARYAGVKGEKYTDLENFIKSQQQLFGLTKDFKGFQHTVRAATKDSMEFARQQRKNAVTFRSVRAELVQLTAAYTAFSGIQNIAQTGFTMEGLRAGALVFAGDQKGVEEHMTFIADEAERLGTNFEVSAKEFTKFAIATKGKVSTQGGRDIFSGVSEYAAVLQADPMQFERAFRSINQMLSKGQLMKEEVTGQLTLAA